MTNFLFRPRLPLNIHLHQNRREMTQIDPAKTPSVSKSLKNDADSALVYDESKILAIFARLI